MQRDRALASARAFLSCPFDLIANMLFMNPNGDWHLWCDSEGNRLRILKNRSVQVYPALTNPIKTKDLFRKSPPFIIERNSYWGMLISGENKDILIFLGNDGKIRASLFTHNMWVENISPLLLGFCILKYISSVYLESDVRIVNSLTISYPKDFIIEKAWAFGIPIEDDNIKGRVIGLIGKD